MDDIVVATSGNPVKQDELRAYIHCSQFHFYGGKINARDRLAILEAAFERAIFNYLKTPTEDITFLATRYAIKAIRQLNINQKLLKPEINALTREMVLLLNEVFTSFPLKHYIPVYSRFEYNIKISKTLVTLYVSGIFKEQERNTLHLVAFTPYIRQLDIFNDPVHYLQLNSLRNVSKRTADPNKRAKLHIFGITDAQRLFYKQLSTPPSDEQKQRITTLIKMMELDYHYPVTPCNNHCPFKKSCKVE